MRRPSPFSQPSPVTRLALVSLATLAVACGGGDSAMTPRDFVHDSLASEAVSASPPSPTDAAEPQLSNQALALEKVAPLGGRPDATASGNAVAAARALSSEPSRGRASVAGAAQPANAAMIIRHGNATVEVDSLERAIAAVRQVATSLGGWVGNLATFTGEHDVRSATLELKVPAAQFDQALAGLRPLGKVETFSATAEDVGEEFVDLQARTANARRLEERLVVLLATRTGKLDDVLSVERELARVREEIERQEGRLRYLRSRVAVSTLVVTVHEPVPLVTPSVPGEHVLGEAFEQAWRNFVRLVAATIAASGTIVPVALVLLLAWAGWRRTRERRAAATTA